MKTHSDPAYFSPSTRKPAWLRVRRPGSTGDRDTWKLLRQLDLDTVCEHAACPNVAECFARRTATFLLMGSVCTRNCRFCNVTSGNPQPLDPREGARIAEAAARMSLRYLVLTSVTRDDLPDGGAAHWVATIRAVRARLPALPIEVLIPPLPDPTDVIAAAPTVLAHNVETVPALYSRVRPQADYRRSLELLARTKDQQPNLITKSAIMVGLGETDSQILAVLADLRRIGCDRVVIGQYLQPSRRHLPVRDYVTPQQFDRFADLARHMGFSWVLSAPLARSSYHAGEDLS